MNPDPTIPIDRAYEASLAKLRELASRQTNADKVYEWHEMFGVRNRSVPTANIPEAGLRVRLIAEELKEYEDALYASNVVEIADALADLLYVVYGAAHVHGIPIDEVFAEVHRSNMAKLGPDGRPILREDGKVLKPEGWQPPDIASVLLGTPPGLDRPSSAEERWRRLTEEREGRAALDVVGQGGRASGPGIEFKYPPGVLSQVQDGEVVARATQDKDGEIIWHRRAGTRCGGCDEIWSCPSWLQEEAREGESALD